MIIKEYGTEKIVCDGCDLNEHEIEGDFNAEIAVMKDEGWRITRPEGHWHHECPQCAGNHLSPLERAKAKFGIR